VVPYCTTISKYYINLLSFRVHFSYSIRRTIASQLPANLTKILITSDSYRLKSTVDQINVDFHIPVGVQLLNIYISLADYNLLIRDAQKARTMLCTANTNNNNNTILPYAVNNKKKIMGSKDHVAHMKRDKSIIFTHIPEEESNHEESENKYEPLPMMAMKKLIRPNHLPLRFKNVTARDLPESGFSSINFDENDSFPDFIGKTSVCSTPMTENKVLQVGNLMSICANIVEVKGSEEFKEEDEKETVENSPEKSPPKSPAIADEDFHASFSNFITNPHKLDMRRKSWTNLSNTFKKLTQLSVKPFNFGIQMGEILDNSEIVDNKLLDDYEDALIDDDDLKLQQHYSTITDPSYPIFNSNGMPLSKYSFQDFLEYHYSDLSKNLR
jgi:Hermansky-Pudlak syndrome 4 protein